MVQWTGIRLGEGICSPASLTEFERKVMDTLLYTKIHHLPRSFQARITGQLGQHSSITNSIDKFLRLTISTESVLPSLR